MAETDTVHPMTGRWARAVTLLVGVAATTGACSGSDGATPATPLESAEPITAPPSTDAEVSTTVTTEPSASTTTSTSTIATTTTTTEPAPTTTTLDDLRAEIEADLNEGEQAFLEAASAPDSDYARELSERYQTGPALDRVLALLDEYAANGEVLRPAPDIANRIEVLSIDPIDEIFVGAVICRIDAAWKVVPASGNNPEQVVDDRVGRFITVTDLLFQDGIWTIASGDTTSVDVGVSTCTA